MAHPGGHRLALTVTVPATPDAVFGLLVDPLRLPRWWGPHGFTTPAAELELRIGGRYRLTMQPPDGAAFHLGGQYLELDPPRRLSYTFRWEEPAPDDRETVVVLVLEAVPGGTRLRLAQGPFATAERLELHRGGWTDSFERLRTLVEAG